MSGIEVIGIVLGVLPLLIKAVEEYEKGLGPLGMLCWPSKYRQELQRLDRQLRTQRDLFEMSLRVLLSSTIDDFTASRLITGATEASWNTPKMKATLGEAVPAGCLIVIEDMANTLKQFHIVLQEPKLKFSFNQQKRDDLMKDLRRYNSDLQGFASHQMGLDRGLPIRRVTVPRGGLSQNRLRRVRLLASDLYSAIEHCSRSQSDSCHVANLYVEIQDTMEDPQCHLLLAQMLPSSSNNAPPQWSMREVVATVADTKAPQLIEQETESHCTTLEGLMEAKAGSQLFIAGSTHGFQVQTKGELKTANMKAQNIYHLSHILDKPDILATGLARRWHRWQRAQIAVSLAHAVLQLHKSPWLESSWNSGDIQISCDEANKSYAASWSPSISRPFHLVSNNLEPTQPSAAQPSKESIIAAESMSIIPIRAQRQTLVSKRQGGPRVRNRDLYSLGIILVELAFNTALRQKREESDYDDTHGPDADAWIDHNTVCRLLENELVWEMGPQYASVVRRCIHGFDTDTHDLENPTFHDMVYSGIFSLLQRDMILRGPSERYLTQKVS